MCSSIVRSPFLALVVVLFPAYATAFQGYYGHPAVHGERIVFQAEGDLWLAPLAGGTAERLTTHVEVESQPVFSRDGRRVAFLAGYDGGREVYVMPLAGGSPKRITFEDEPVGLEGWTDEGEVLITSSAVPGPLRRTVIRAIDPVDLSVRDWPLLNASEAALAPGGTMYVTRYGRRVDHAKAYRGGAMAQLWRYAPGADEAERLLADFKANVQRPLFAAGRLYFLSDADGIWNLWSVDERGGDARQHTRHATFAARDADTDGETIVYQHGADLFRFDPATGRSARVPLEIRSDFDHARERFVAEPLEYAEALTLAPQGDRLAVAARGRLVLAGLPRTRRVTLSVPADLRVRQARVGPEGDWVYALVADGAQDEIVRLPADGSSGLEPVTQDGSARRWRFALSPDGAWLAHNDSRGRLWLTATDSGDTRLVAQNPVGNDVHAEFVFSPASDLLAFTDTGGDRATLHLHELASGRTKRIASTRFAARAPAFSQDGRWLYFVSDRNFAAKPSAPWGDRNLGPVFDARGRILSIDLTGEGRFPFLPADLGGPVPENDIGDDEGEADEDTGAVVPVPVAWNGLADRLYEVPVDAGNYRALRASADRLFVLDAPFSGPPVLKSIPIGEAPETETFAEKVAEYDLTPDGERLYFRIENALYIVDAGPSAPEKLTDATVVIDGWRLPINPREEWSQMFHDAWRMHRDFSFDPAMRGLDWEAVRDRYAPLLSRISHRAELDDLLGEMISELDILHSAVRGAELPEDEESPAGATLAAEFRPVHGGLEILRIYSGDPDLPEERSPLARPEVGVRVGDVLTAVNHSPVRDRADLAAALADQAGQPVLLELRRSGEAAHEVAVAPLKASELPRLRYRDWEQKTRAHVDASSDGRIGYLHLYAMGRRDIADFAREFFAQNDRQGLVIDVRSNRGGNIDSWVIGELARSAWSFWQAPLGHNMQQAFRGHLAVLVDAHTYSDGETFAAGVKALDLAPLIGTRTAGAGIWLTDRNTLVDGGVARIAEFAQFDLEGNWIVEGHGVNPDIEVDNLPHESYAGRDAQLERAVEYLEARIREAPVRPLRGEPIPPVGTPGRDVRRGSAP